MNIHIIDAGFFKLDGGAMFGVVPYTMWSRLNPPDANNMCTWAMRCLLIETGDRKILIDAGIGDKQDEKFLSFFDAVDSNSLLVSVRHFGFNPEDITDVFLTHLHFDHCGGALKRNVSGDIVPTFPNATYWSNKVHYDWACNPNMREKASFLKENFVPLHDHGVLKFIPVEQDIEWIPGIRIRFVYGHTEAMMIPHIQLDNGNELVYCADLMPSSYHIRLPYVMAYDIRPLVTLEERKDFYTHAIQDHVYLFFEHDPKNPLGKLTVNEKGRYGANTDIDWMEVIGHG